MNPGTLDQPVEIHHYIVTRNSIGGETKAWQKFASCRARVKDNKGTEKIDANRLTEFGFTSFFIRYIAGVNAAMVVKFEGDTYNIKSINRRGRKAMLELLTEKKQ